jgi:hypothetical protein
VIFSLKEMEQENSEESNIRIDNDPDKKVDISNLQEQIKKNPWMISTIVLGIIALILLILVFRGGGITGNVISADVAGERLIEFASSQGADATLVGVNDNGEFYEVIVSINGQNLPLYVTKDGEFFTQALIPLTGDVVNQQQQQQPSIEVPKSDKPEVELYVFTYCPYGTQAEKGIVPVLKLLGDKIDFKLRQVGAMHDPRGCSGTACYESLEAKRQLCIEKEYPTKLLDYINEFALDAEIGNCRGDDTCVTPLIDKLYAELGISKAKVDACIETDSELLYSAELENSGAQGVSGSPTLIINGEKVQSSRDSASYLETICSAFNTAPAECDEVLSSASPSPGFGASTTTGSASAEAQC